MHFQLEGNSLDNASLFIRHVPLQWISLYEGFEREAGRLLKDFPLQNIAFRMDFPL